MTEKEAIERLKYDLAMITFNPMTGDETPLWLLSEDEQGSYNAYECAIKALEEIQQYREIGTVEQVKNQKHNLEVAYKIIGNYQGIGTVEECRELKERNTPKKAKLISGLSPMCPECGASILKNYDNCKRCGQAIDWSKE